MSDVLKIMSIYSKTNLKTVSRKYLLAEDGHRDDKSWMVNYLYTLRTLSPLFRLLCEEISMYERVYVWVRVPVDTIFRVLF